jgi:L-histidine Nalpha-methyltransferase
MEKGDAAQRGGPMVERASPPPAGAALRREVWSSLRRPQKELSPKYFYDARGSALFDHITRLDEYYLTRIECALLGSFAAPWISEFGARSLVELGPGSADKARLLLDALPAPSTVYVPVDISTTYLNEIGATLAAEYPGLTVRAVRADISRELGLPAGLPEPRAVAFLGSTIGNFYPDEAVALLRRLAAVLEPTDRLLLGVDLRKERAILEHAYNDSQGVTCEFNLNVLRVLNRELGTDFDLAAYEHRATWNDAAGRIEMQLVARTAQRVHVPACGTVEIEAGEAIRTEISTKYDRATIEGFFDEAGLALEEWVTDDREWFALVVGRQR